MIIWKPKPEWCSIPILSTDMAFTSFTESEVLIASSTCLIHISGKWTYNEFSLFCFSTFGISGNHDWFYLPEAGMSDVDLWNIMYHRLKIILNQNSI